MITSEPPVKWDACLKTAPKFAGVGGILDNSGGEGPPEIVLQWGNLYFVKEVRMEGGKHLDRNILVALYI